MIVRRIYNEPLAQASYLIGCAATGEALIVDPNRAVEQYIELAAREGLRITAVTETHIHADFVSGARELATHTGAQLYLSDMGPADWKYAFAADADARLLQDHDSFMVGNVRVEALHTPGHTPEHLSFLVTDTAGANEPMAILSGDFVFVGDVGRPDLLEKAAGVIGSSEQAARSLFRSLEQFKRLPDYLQIWPGHGAGSACGRALGAVPQTTVGYERRFNWALDYEDEDTFVAAVLDGQPEPPPYFATMKRVNKAGPLILGKQGGLARLPQERLAHALDAGMIVVDTRPTDVFAAGHIPGTINIPLDDGFLTWAGWLLPYDRPFALIVDEGRAEEARAQLQLIGLDEVSGYWPTSVVGGWTHMGLSLATVERIAPEGLAALRARHEVMVIDVRAASEHAAGRIDGAQNIPLGHLERRIDELPMDQPVVVHCQSGLRSMIAASILQRHGHQRVRDLAGGFEQWRLSDRYVAGPQAVSLPAEVGEQTVVERGR